MSNEAHSHRFGHAVGERHGEDLGDALIEAMPATDEAGCEPKTPFMVLTWVAVGVAGVVVLLVVLAFVVPYLVTGHWPL
jgi:hypothetical protein